MRGAVEERIDRPTQRRQGLQRRGVVPLRKQRVGRRRHLGQRGVQRLQAVAHPFEQQRAVALRDVVFLLRGMQLNGHVFGRGMDDVPTLARRLLDQVLFLCQREQLPLPPASLALLQRWIAGDLLATQAPVPPG